MNRPNVLLIYPDQLRYDCLSYSGEPTVSTPAIDRLARNGAWFSSAYVSYPLCSPFRASLMTGVYAHRHGMLTNHYPLRLDQDFLPERMNAAGYDTGWIGKWHLDGSGKFRQVPKPWRLGFKTFVGYSRGHEYLNGIYYRDDDPQPYRSDKYEPEYQTDHMIEFMAQALQAGRPFMGMVCYGLPHTPLDSAPPEYRDRYSPADAVLRDTVPERETKAMKAYKAKYLGLVSCVDRQVGRLVNWLSENGALEDTVIIFVSDHGDLMGEHALQYKSSFHEASMHVPLIVHCPGLIAEGSQIDAIVDPSVDLMPTILELCGVDIPESVQGRSLAPLLTGRPDPDRPARVYYQLMKVSDEACRVLDVQECKPFPERGLRTRDSLYVEKCGVPFALYDLQKDPDETYNLVNSVAHLNLLLERRAALREAMRMTGDDWAVAAETPPPDYESHEKGEAFYRKVFAVAVTEPARRAEAPARPDQERDDS